MKKVTIEIDEETHKQLKYFSFKKGVSMTQLIRQGIISIMKEDHKPIYDKVEKVLANSTGPIPEELPDEEFTMKGFCKHCGFSKELCERRKRDHKFSPVE